MKAKITIFFYLPKRIEGKFFYFTDYFDNKEIIQAIEVFVKEYPAFVIDKIKIECY
jgi:hypothetical protein